MDCLCESGNIFIGEGVKDGDGRRFGAEGRFEVDFVVDASLGGIIGDGKGYLMAVMSRCALCCGKGRCESAPFERRIEILDAFDAGLAEKGGECDLIGVRSFWWSGLGGGVGKGLVTLVASI